METIIYAPGQEVALIARVNDKQTLANNPVTGLNVVAAIRRRGDGKWYNFVTPGWAVGEFGAIEDDCTLALTDNGDGTYGASWDQQIADGGAEESYTVTYWVASAGDYENLTDSDMLVFSSENVRASLRTVHLGFAGAEDVTLGEALQAAQAQGAGRWTLDRDTRTLTLFAPDGETAFVTFDLDDTDRPTARVPR